MPTIRHLKSTSDLDAYMNLCLYCFSMTPDYSAYYADFVRPYLEHSWGAFEKDRLIAGMWYIPFEMHIGGGYVPMGGVAAVATYPEARNSGLARTLMTKAHRQMKDEGRPLAVLQPFKPDFYARMGYGDTFYHQQCAVKPASVARCDVKGYVVTPVDGLREWKTFDRLHSEYGSNYFGAVKRSRSYWTHRFFTSGMGQRFHYLIMRGKEARGFIITHVDKARLAYARDAFQPSHLSIVQAVWRDQGSFDAILQFIRGHQDQFDNVQWFLPVDVSVHDRLVDQRIDVALKPKKMLKLVDLKAAIEKRPFSTEFGGEITISVNAEETSPWNDGIWRIQWSGGEARVSKWKSQSRTGHVKTDIQTLSVLYSGHRNASRLSELGLLTGPSSAIELLDRAFPRQCCYIDEWF